MILPAVRGPLLGDRMPSPAGVAHPPHAWRGTFQLDGKAVAAASRKRPDPPLSNRRAGTCPNAGFLAAFMANLLTHGLTPNCNNRRAILFSPHVAACLPGRLHRAVPPH